MGGVRGPWSPPLVPPCIEFYFTTHSGISIWNAFRSWFNMWISKTNKKKHFHSHTALGVYNGANKTSIEHFFSLKKREKKLLPVTTHPITTMKMNLYRVLLKVIVAICNLKMSPKSMILFLTLRIGSIQTLMFVLLVRPRRTRSICRYYCLLLYKLSSIWTV